MPEFSSCPLRTIPGEIAFVMQDILSFGPFQAIRDRRLLLEAGRPVRIGRRAFDLLIALAERSGAIVSTDELVARVWPDVTVGHDGLRALISALRRTLGDHAPDRRYITNVAGRGYCFVAPVTQAESGADEPSGRANVQAAIPIRLPSRLSRMIGRDTFVRELAARVQQHRLVTIVGPGGIGKTTVAIATAEAVAGHFRDGVVFVDLAPLEDPSLVPLTVAAALEVSIESHDAARELVASLRDKQMLLVLDNCEHVIEAAASFIELMQQAAPDVSVLATSRERLRCAGERLRQLRPLASPPADTSVGAAEALEWPAVQLLVERVEANADGFQLHDADVSLALEICRSLDGVPLAIELAAASVTQFGLRGVAELLGDRFSLLRRGRRTALPRQQTLRATLDWSYDMLAPEEQTILRRLALLRGAFDLDLACTVAADAALPASNVPIGISRLAAKSLIVVELEHDPVDYRLLETTRAYGLTKLAELGELDAMSRRHAEAVHEALGRRTGHARRALAADGSAALEWAFSPRGDGAFGVTVTLAAIPLWIEMSLLGECRRRVEQAVSSLDSDADGRNELQLLITLATAMQNSTGPGLENTQLWERAHAIAERLGDQRLFFRTLWGLWIDARNRGEHRKGLVLARRFLDLAITRNERDDMLVGERMVAKSHFILGELAQARTHAERMLERYDEAARSTHMERFHFEQRTENECLLAMILWLQGSFSRALAMIDATVAEIVANGHALQVCIELAQFGCPIAWLAGDEARFSDFVERLSASADAHGLVAWAARGRCWEGLLRIRRGDGLQGIETLAEAVEHHPGGECAFQRVWFLGELARAQADAGLGDAALTTIDLALQRARAGGELWCVPELLRFRAGILLQLGDTPGGESTFAESLDLARRQGALAFELRSATSLARRWRDMDRAAEAAALLRPLVGRFDATWETHDLSAARQVLAMADARA